MCIYVSHNEENAREKRELRTHKQLGLDTLSNFLRPKFFASFFRTRKKGENGNMKASHRMLFFVSFLVVFENAKALETECDVCHVNYYHKVCAYYYLL